MQNSLLLALDTGLKTWFTISWISISQSHKEGFSPALSIVSSAKCKEYLVNIIYQAQAKILAEFVLEAEIPAIRNVLVVDKVLMLSLVVKVVTSLLSFTSR